jgi:hypothetical protein
MTPADYSCVTLSSLVTHIMYFFHYAPGPACRGSASLYVPPLNYKREGTQRYKGHAKNTHSIQLTHSGGRVLCSGGLNHYNPSCPLVFIPNSPNRQPLRPPPHLRIRAGAFRHPAGGFSHRQGIFGFLLSSSTVKSLNDTKLEEHCTKFANTFSRDGLSDVEVHDLISELKIMKFTLLDEVLSAMEIFEHVR